MRTGFLVGVLVCMCLVISASAQQVPYSGKHHSTSRGGYTQGGVNYSHRGGLFRKTVPLGKLVRKKH